MSEQRTTIDGQPITVVSAGEFVALAGEGGPRTEQLEALVSDLAAVSGQRIDAFTTEATHIELRRVIARARALADHAKKGAEDE